MSAPSPTETYAFDNDDAEAAHRHEYLAAMLDGFTCARLSSLGDLAGRRCLELGAGGGSIAQWLAERTGPSGHVLATDLNTRYLSPASGYAVASHDLTSEPVPPGPWDVIHARLVLQHLPARREVLPRLAAALAPGGALVVEEWDSTVGDFVLAAPSDDAAELALSFQAAVGRILRSHGVDQSWARQVHAAMGECGLVDLDTEVHARAWPGGTPGTLLITVTLAQLRDQLLAAGFTEEQLDRVHQLFHDPRLVWRGILTYSTIGRRPAG